MTRGRIETTPTEQLAALREARDRYKALADQIRDGAEAPGGPEEKSRAEQDARRIANAYEKTIANILASARAHESPEHAPTSGRLWTGLMALSLLICVAVAAVFLLGRGAARTDAGTDAANMAAAMPKAENSNKLPAPGSVKTGGAAAPAATPAPGARPAIVPRQPSPAARATDLKGRGRPRANAIRRPSRDAGPSGDSGFVVKVLQPDGSLRDELFPPSTSLR